MNVSTSRFGTVEVSEESLVTFASGLVGLPTHTRYAVFEVEGGGGYQWLQSLDDETLAVVMMPAEILEPDFVRTIPQESVAELDIQDDDQVSISVIVTIPPGQPDRATANFRAPIVVNLRTRMAKQVILHESIPLHVPLMPDHANDGVAVETEQVCLEGAIKA
ncbi:MAG: flagellar assembly protein FliW [Nitrospirales bacterium]|nr:flagellar assembly protein FliW [Nitrospira sp.]MDR4502340.1 flagellar assembly protein FliW [Nitrospirales bacterium]